MNQNERAIVRIIEKIQQINAAPCKKTVQKIVYLIEEKGINLGMGYGIHFYGPYSEDLDFVIYKMCADHYLKIDYTEHGHLISAAGEWEAEEKDVLSAETEKIVEEFARDTPSELELLATTLYVAKSKRANGRDFIIKGVKKIKGSKYSEEKILKAMERLQKFDYITG